MSVDAAVNTNSESVIDNTLRVFLLDAEPASPPSQFSTTASIQIGRHGKNDIVLDNDRISRFHATVFFDGTRWHCACIGRNGMYCAGEQVAHAEIKTGLVLQFAKNGPRLLFEFDGGETDADGMGSMTRLINDLKENRRETSMQLWSRCFAALARLARQRLRSIPRRAFDEEDVASRVLADLFLAAQEGKLENVTDRESLWRLLIAMTVNTAGQAVEHERRQKRGGGRVRGDSVNLPAFLKAGDQAVNTFDRFASRAPTPDSVAAIDDLMRAWLTALETNELRDIALLKLEGRTTNEIAEATQLPTRTVERRLQTIRTVWQELTESSSRG